MVKLLLLLSAPIALCAVGVVLGILTMAHQPTGEATPGPSAPSFPLNQLRIVDAAFRRAQLAPIAYGQFKIQNDGSSEATAVQISCAFLNRAGVEVGSGSVTLDAVPPNRAKGFPEKLLGPAPADVDKMNCAVTAASGERGSSS